MPAPEGYKVVRNPVTKEEETVPRAEGWNLTKNERRKLWELSNDKEIENWVDFQARLPPAMRDYSNQTMTKQGGIQPPDRSRYNVFSLDVFSTGGYIVGGQLKNIQEAQLTGTPGNRSVFDVKEAIPPSEVLLPDNPKDYTELAARWDLSQHSNPLYRILPQSGKKLYTDIVLDPITYITGGGPKFVTSGGKAVQLSLAGKAKQLTTTQKLLSKTTSTEGVVAYHISPEVRHIISKQIKDNAKYLRKEGYGFIYTDFVFLPRKYAPWLNLGGIASKTGTQVNNAYVALKNRALSIHLGLPSFMKRSPTETGLAIDPKYDVINRAINTQAKIVEKTRDRLSEIAALEKEAKNILGQNAGQIITEVLENPKLKHSFPQIGHIISQIESIHTSMAAEEKALGILRESRTNYIRHMATNQYLKLQKLMRSDVAAGAYGLARKFKKTISEENLESLAKNGVKKFEDNSFVSISHRVKEYVATTEVVKYANDIKKLYGVTKAEAQKLGGYAESKNPFLKGTYLPTELLRILDQSHALDEIQKLPGKNGVGITGKALWAYDAYNNFWRRMTTLPFPEFHSKNLEGSLYKNVMSGVNFLTWGKFKAKEVFKKPQDQEIMIEARNGVKYTKEQVHRIGQELGVYDKNVGPAGEAVGNTYGEGVWKYPKAVASWIEQNVREQQMIDALEQGDDMATIKAKIDFYHFNYKKQYSEIEEDIFKRIIPFYTWARENRLAELTMMATMPNKYATIGKLLDSGKTEKQKVQESFMPDYMKEGAVRPIGNNGTWIGVGMPFEDVTKLQGQLGRGEESFLGSNIYPLLQAPIEIATGREMYTGKDIENWGEWAIKKSPFGRAWSLGKFLADEDKTWQQKVGKQFGINIYNSRDWIWQTRNSPDGVVRMSIRRLGGKPHGCGW